MTQRAPIALLALTAVLAFAAPAQAAKVFQGETGQSRPIALRVGDQGRVARVDVRWQARCRRRGTVVRDRTVARLPRRATTTEVFSFAGGYAARQRGGYRVIVGLAIEGRRDVRSDGVERWTGTLAVRAIVRRRGRRVTRCSLRETVWHAELPLAPVSSGEPPAPAPPANSPTQPPPATPGPWRFEMTGDSGDYITGGQNWGHGPPHDTVSVSGGSGAVHFRIETSEGSWTGDFAAPTGDKLEPGRTYTGARRYPFQEGAAGIDVSGMGRGCNQQEGQFTIEELGFDDRGRVRRLRLSFEQHCEGGDAAARGTFDYSTA